MGIPSIPPVGHNSSFSAAKLPEDRSQMRSFWYGEITGSALKGRELHICRTFSAELAFGLIQTFHVWLGSFGGFAASIRV